MKKYSVPSHKSENILQFPQYVQLYVLKTSEKNQNEIAKKYKIYKMLFIT